MAIRPPRWLASIISLRTVLISWKFGRSKSTIVISFSSSTGSSRTGLMITTFFGLALRFSAGSRSRIFRMTCRSGCRFMEPK